MGLFGTNMGDFQLGLAMDDKAGGDLRCINQLVTAESWPPRHRRDASSMA